MKESIIKQIQADSIPNEYLEYDIRPRKKSIREKIKSLKNIKMPKLAVLDMIIIPVAVLFAVSAGILAYQIAQFIGNDGNLATLLRNFII